MIRIVGALALLVCLVLDVQAPAQIILRRPGQDQPDLTIDDKMVRDVVEGAIKNLNEAYVFPETAAKIEADLRQRLRAEEYNGIRSAKKLAQVLSDQIQAIAKDKHLHLRYSYEPLPEMPKPPDRNSGVGKANDARAQMHERMLAHMRTVNFGFEKVERLEGNIGYLKFNGFHLAEEGGATAAAAMNFLAHTDALIIDLRENRGGSPDMVALIASYFFGGQPVHLNDLYFRPENSTHQWWTLPYVPGRRYEGKPVYVLTSQRTFSAAEEFTYDLQCLKRATIVGETTGGGAHPAGPRKINEHFVMMLPTGRAINPVTKTDWEGTGITPDVPVPAEQALKTAYLAALKAVAKDLTERAKDSKRVDPMQLEQVKKAIEPLEKELDKKDPGHEAESGRQQPSKG